MQLPNANLASVAAEKIRDYLPSPSHPVGRFKASFFASLGFTQQRWEELERQIRDQALIGGVVDVYGDMAVEVEFVTGAGRTQALLSLPLAQVRPISPTDIPAVRPLGSATAA